MKKVLYLFGQLNDQDLEWLIKAGKKEHIRKHTILIEKNSRVEKLYIVLSGNFQILIGEKNDKCINHLGSGEIIGEMSMVSSNLPYAQVKADMDSEVYALEKEILIKKLNDDTGFAARFYRAISIFLAERLRSSVLLFGYGNENLIENRDHDELENLVIDNVAIAGDRFHRLLTRI